MGITAGKAQGGEQVMEINTSNLAPGTYMYQVVYGNRIGIEKFIVK